MKKRMIFWVGLCCLTNFLHAQWHDRRWVLGAGRDTLDFGTVDMVFQEDTMQLEYNNRALIQRNFGMGRTQISVSDSIGNYLFACNGSRIFNRNNRLMTNGDSINYNQWWENNGQYWYPVIWSMTYFPNYRDSSYNLYHTRITYIRNAQGNIVDVGSELLYETKVSFARDTMGEVLYKNRAVTSDSTTGTICGTRHGNGKDWWLVYAIKGTSCFKVMLKTEAGIVAVDSACFTGLDFIQSDGGQINFSLDGSKLARTGFQTNCLDVLDFDRCTGTLSNARRYPVESHNLDSGWVQAGVIFSPNGRFVYQIHNLRILQFDLEAADVLASVDTVGVYARDSASGGAQPYYFIAQNGPDGKIYISSTNGRKELHVIRRPNEKGAACQFVRNGQPLGRYIEFGLPNHPNFRLGRLRGSSCDTIYQDTTVGVHSIYGRRAMFRVYPNPAASRVQAEYNWIEWERYQKLELVLSDLSGRILRREPVAPYSVVSSMELSGISSGLYQMRLLGDGALLGVSSVVVE